MKYSFKIGSVYRIPIELHLTFLLLIIAFFVLFYPNFYYPILMILLFVFVFFHELAHSFVARHYKIKVRKIVLYPIGGVSEIEEIPENPSIEWRLAISGPLTSLAIGAALFGASQLFVVSSTSATPVYLLLIGNFLFDLASLNLLLGLFNLIPALPMDGGRVFRALLSRKMGYTKATKYSVYLGRIFGIIFVIVGFLINIWLVLIGIFVYIGASEESQQTAASTALARIHVGDVMQLEFRTVNPEQNVEEIFQDMFQHGYQEVIVQKDEAFLGILTWSELAKVGPQQRSHSKVEAMPLKSVSIFDDATVLEASRIIGKENIGLLPAVRKEAPFKIVGVITKAIIEALLNKPKS